VPGNPLSRGLNQAVVFQRLFGGLRRVDFDAGLENLVDHYDPARLDFSTRHRESFSPIRRVRATIPTAW
jgi:hypothetical protein